MLPIFLASCHKRLLAGAFLFLFSFILIPHLHACDGSDTVIDALLDNGDGTYTITATITIAGADWAGGIWGGTRGFYFNTDQPILSVSPPSFTSMNGTTLPAVITGNQVNWGDPFAGPFFVAPTDLTQSFTFTLVVGGQPTTWTAGGQEVGNCVDTGTFPCPLPGLNVLSGDQTVCEGTQVVLSVDAPGADQVTWSNGSSGTSITVTPTVTTVYTVTATNNCGPVTTNITVTVNPLPIMTPDIPQQTICQGQSVNLSVTTQNITNISWSPIPGTGNMVTDAPTVTTTYTAVGSNQCGTVTVNMTVDVVDYPQAFAINSPLDICLGQGVTLEAIVQNADAIFWSPNSSSTNTAFVVPDFSQTYTVFASNYCGLVSADFVVNVDDGPDITFISEDQTACSGDQVNLLVVSDDANDFLWTPGNHTTSSIDIIADVDTTYTVIVINNCGFDSAQVDIIIEELPTLDIVSGSQPVCEGLSVTLEVDTSNANDVYWMPGNIHSTSITVTPTTTTTYTAFAVNDCDEVSSDITVTITPPATSSLQLEACEGTTANYQGTSLPIGSSTDFTLTGPSGCDSVVTVTVVQVDIVTSSLQLEACEGTTASYEGQNLPIGSSTDFTFTAANGCDSVVTVTVAQVDNVSSNLQLETCEGTTATYEGQDLPIGSSTDFTFTAANGCDSVVTVTVAQVDNVSSNLQLETCEGTTASYEGQNLAIGSSTDFTFTAANGCDSVVTVTVAQVDNVSSNLQLETCEGTTASYEGQDLPIGSSTDFTFTAANGCDSVVTVTVAQVDNVSSNLQLETCEGTTATYEGQDLPIGSSTDFTFTAANGCDSVVTVTVAQVDNVSSNLQLETCEGTTASYEGQDLPIGSSTDFTFTAANGCDSVVTVTVAQVDNVSSNLQLETCEGTTATYEGQDLPIGSSTDFTFTAANGCDSVVTVTVAQVDNVSSNLQLETCEGTTASYEGQDLPIGSSTDFTFTAANGCDSVVTVTVAQVDNVSSNLQLETCEGTTATYEGQDLPIGSSTDFTFTAANGCDSVVTVTVAQVDNVSSNLQLETCEGTTATYEGQDLPIGSSTDFTFTAANGCDSVVTVTVAQVDNVSSNLQLETCEGTTASYEGQNLPIGSSTDFTFTAANGCDSVVTVTVAQVDNVSSNLQLETCEGTTASYEGQNLPIGSSTDFTFTAANGCDSVVTVTVAQVDNVSSNLQLETCEGTTATYEGQDLPIGSSTDFTFTAANGCDSVVTVTVAQVDNVSSNLQLETCEGTTASYEGQNLPIGSSTDFTFTAANGCDSVVTVTVAGLDNFTSDLALETCDGTTISYQGQDLAIGSMTDFTLSAMNGCDSVVTVSVSAIIAYTSDLELQTCNGTSASYNGQNLAIGSNTDFTFAASNGCDSIVTVSVVGINSYTSTEVLSACEGSTALYNGTALDAGTSMDFAFVAVNGCDSLVTVSVQELEVYQAFEQLEACEGNTASYQGQDLAVGSSTDFTFTAQNGCDSVVTVAVAGLPIFSSDLTLTICEGNTATYENTDLAVGTVTNFTLTALNGCDSVVTVRVDGVNIIYTNLELETCQGTAVTYNGQSLAIGSSTDFTFVSSAGCDSVVTVQVAGIDAITSSLNLEACDGSSATYDGLDLPVGFSSDFFYTTANGCDSIVTVTVSGLPNATQAIELTACEGTTADYNGQQLAIGSSTDFLFGAANGCDSTVTVSVRGLNTAATDVALEACSGGTASYNGQDLPAGSSMDFNYLTFEGCDSVVTVTVAELPTYSSDLQLQACQGAQASYNGQSLDIGTSTDFTLAATNGCDSVVRVSVIGVAVITNTIALEACEGNTASYEGQDLTIGSSTDFSYIATNGCDSIVTVSVQALSTFATDVQLEACQGTQADYNGSLLDIGTSTDFTFASIQNGCDSTVTVSVIGLDTYAVPLDLQACEGSSIDYNGQSLVAGSSMDFTFSAANGCDSVVTVSVESLEVYSGAVNLEACEGSTATYNGVALDIGSQTDFTFTAANGCDSVITVSVDALQVFASSLQLEACEGSTASYMGQQLSIGSMTDFTLSAQNSCDSVVTVSVVGLEVFEEDLVLETCEGSSIIFDGQDLPPNSVTDFTYQSISGCDSVVTVFVMDIIPLAFSEEDRTLCDGDSTFVFDTYVSAAGSYDGIFPAANGCDSTHTIHIEVLPALDIDILTEQACPGEASGSASALVNGGLPPYTYNWNGTPSNSTELPLVSAGIYQLTVSDAMGCSQVIDFNIGEHSIDLAATHADVSCFGYSDGEIVVENVNPGWTFSLNGGPFTNSPLMGNLPAANYSLTVMDEFGCEYESSFLINQPPPVIIDVIQDTTIVLGEDIFLLSNNNWDDLLDYLWTPAESLDCDLCPIPVATPAQTTVYQVVVTNENGCTGTDEVEIVVRSGHVFIPNVFSPDNNGSNDLFMIHADQSVARVLDFRIFSRWGEVVFEANNFPPNEPDFAWDGSYRGDRMDPAVFVYYALIEFVDGSQELFKGGVTLVK